MFWRAQLAELEIQANVTLRGTYTQASRLSWATSRLPNVVSGDRDLAATCYQYATKCLSDDRAEPLALVHRDFSLRNILAERKDGGSVTLTAVLDFEHAFVGSPTSDIADLIIEDFPATPEFAVALIEAWRADSPTLISKDWIVGAIGISLLLGLVTGDKCELRKRRRAVATRQVLEWLKDFSS